MRTTEQMSIPLPNDMADTVKPKGRTGGYASESEVIRDGLRALMARNRAVERWLHAFTPQAQAQIVAVAPYRYSAEAASPGRCCFAPPSRWRPVCRALCLTAAMLLAGCAGPAPPAPWPGRLLSLLPADVLLLGEQHDAAEHQRLQRQAVQWLAARGQLAAVVIEMAEQGRSTHGLSRQASAAEARAALQWDDAAWPWSAYGPVVLAAVAAGVPVLGGNLPRSRMRAAMADADWDRHLPAPALQRQYEALHEGHCGLLPRAQLAPMARVQVARDASLARTAQQALQPGQTVVLLAGNGHVLRSLGVPTHWPASLVSKVVVAITETSHDAIENDADMVIATPALAPRDACAPLGRVINCRSSCVTLLA